MTERRRRTRTAASGEVPEWSRMLRALREASGLSREAWSALLGYGRTTVQRWETGETAPDAEAEAAILALCRERALFRRYERGVLAREPVSEAWLSDLLAQARLGGDGGRAPGPPGVEAGAGDSNVPHPLTSFIGRQAELAAVARLLAETRLLTLTGAGGAGKTRLALEAARALMAGGGTGSGGPGAGGERAARAYADGVWWVELAAVADGALVAATVAATLGLREEGGRPVEETLVRFLGGRRLLLVLDNCEHLLDACARLAGVLLRACPSLTLLATSRRRLGITGETVFRVPPLSVEAPGPGGPESWPGPAEAGPAEGRASEAPDLDSPRVGDAVRLFVERARAVRPSFRPDGAGLATAARICARLDGMPLAIELAAARLGVLSLDQIDARLDDRFRLLTGGSRIDAPRHQTLRALVDWSYDLLDPEEQRLFERLSVFAGGFELEAAEAVCADPPPGPLPQGRGSLHAPLPPAHSLDQDQRWSGQAAVRQGSPSLEGGGRGVGPGVLDLLARLVDASLVTVEAEGAGGEVRYRLAETLRQYAAERLAARGEADAVAERQRDYLLALAEAAEPRLRGPEQGRWLDRLAANLDNIRAALRWSEQTGDDVAALRLAAALLRFWEVRGLSVEGRGRLERLIERATAPPPSLRAKALNAAGTLAIGQGDYPAAGALHERALQAAREAEDRAAIAWALVNLGLVRANAGDNGAADELIEQGLALRRALGDQRETARALFNLGYIAHRRGDLERARSLYEEYLAMMRALGDSEAVAGTLTNLADLTLRLGDGERAAALFEESLALRRALGDERGAVSALHGLGETAAGRGDRAAAGGYFAEALLIAREVGMQRHVAECLEGLAGVAAADGRFAAAARLLGGAAAVRAATDLSTRSAVERAGHERVVAAVRGGLGEEAYAAALSDGRAAALDRLIVGAVAPYRPRQRWSPEGAGIGSNDIR